MRFKNLIKLFDSQNVLSEVENTVVKDLSRFGCLRDDLVIAYE